MKKRTVFLTGASGNMGGAGLQELLQRTDQYQIKLLVRPSQKNKEKMAYLAGNPSVEIVWGDLLDYDSILAGVTGADVVLHLGGMVTPMADYHPKKTLYTNITSVQYLVKAILAQPNAEDIRMVYVGTVAQVSDRTAPYHWGRTGDPILMSVYDHYALSKTEAERLMVESGIKHWVSIRQSAMLHAGLFSLMDPTMFHVPLNGVLELTTIEDSGRALANVCSADLPDSFWNHFYNLGSGASYRVTNYEFYQKLFQLIHCPGHEKIFEPNWFATRNFHGMWFEDSDKLEEILHFRANLPLDTYLHEVFDKKIPRYYHLAFLCPPAILKAYMRKFTQVPTWGTQWWIQNHDEAHIKACYGSLEAYKAIPTSWKELDLSRPSDKPTNHWNHGYDESKPREEWTLEDMQQAAAFRGWKCLSQTMVKGDYATKLEWECADGHRFWASPVLILEGGHMCPHCHPMAPCDAPLDRKKLPALHWNYNHVAKINPFFRQVWETVHGKEERDEFTEEIFNGWPD